MVYFPDNKNSSVGGTGKIPGADGGEYSQDGTFGSPSQLGGIPGRTAADYLHWFFKYSWLIVLTTFVGVLAGLYNHKLSPPVYQSRAAIEFKRIKREAVDIDESEKLKLDALAYFASTLEKLKMRSLYENIAASPAFAERKDLLPRGKHWRWPWQEADLQQADSSGVSPAKLASMMPGWVEVRQRENTTIVDLYARHSSPEVCRDVLEQLIIEYERYTEGEVSGSEKYALEFLFEKSEAIEQKIMSCQTSLDQYRECLKFDRMIETTRDKIVQLRTRYRDKWPPLIEAQELIRLASKEFDRELSNVLASSKVESDYWAEQAPQVGEAGDPLASKQKILHSRVNLLEKRLAQQEAMLVSLMTKISAADLSQGFEGKQFSVIQPPTLPGGRIAPIRSEMVRQGGMGGFAIGAGLVLLLGFLDNSVRTVGELEKVAGNPVVGVIPKVATTKGGKQRPLFALNDPDGYSSESMRSLRTSLSMLGNADRQEPSTYLVTSALPGEGKSVISANLAVSFAQQHDRTLLIDCDLRKPVQQHIFDCDPNALGLSDHLANGVGLEEIVQRTNIADLFVIAAGTRSPNPAGLLGSRALAEFLREVEEHFDRVIIDSAPVIPVSDTLPVAREVQSVVLACQLGKTPRKALQRSLKVLSDNRTPPVGVVANHLPLPKSRLLYGYYYGYYSGSGYEDYREARLNQALPRATRDRSRRRGLRSQRCCGRKYESDAKDLLS